MIPKYFRLGREKDPLFAETEIKMFFFAVECCGKIGLYSHILS